MIGIYGSGTGIKWFNTENANVAIYLRQGVLMEKRNDDLTREDLFKKRRTFIFDIECYSNSFLASFMGYETGKFISFEGSPDSEMNLADLDWILNNFLIS